MHGRTDLPTPHPDPDPAPASGANGRHRPPARLPGPVGLAVLVAVLLVAFGVGAALLPATFARGDDAGSRATTGTAADDAAKVNRLDAAGTGVTGTGPNATPTPAPTRPGGTGGKPLGPVPRKTVKPDPTKPRGGNTAKEDQVTALVNEERAKAGCGRVRTDERLRKASRGHSQDMADRNYFSHDSLDGRSPWDRAKAAGYNTPIGENIAKGQRTPADVMKAWMNSPGHRANILNCDAKAIGVGLAYDGNTPIWTQLFGSK